jgi:uncharacterized membrane protein
MSSTPQNESNDSNKKPLEMSHPFESYKEPIKAMLGIATFAASITYTTILTPREQSTPAIAELAYANSLFFGVIMGCVLIIVSIEINCTLIEIERETKEIKDKEKALKTKEIKDEEKVVEEYAITYLLQQITKIRGHKRVHTFIHKWLIPLEVWVVAVTLFTAFFLMLHASSLFLQYNGPFIVGSVLYLGLGAVAFILWFFLLYLNAKVSKKRNAVLWHEAVKKYFDHIDKLDKRMESLAKGIKSEEKIEKSAEKIEMSEVKVEKSAEKIERSAEKMEKSAEKMENNYAQKSDRSSV